MIARRAISRRLRAGTIVNSWQLAVKDNHYQLPTANCQLPAVKMFKRIVTLLLGIGLISLGLLFFIEPERLFVIHILTRYWPLFLIIAGLIRVSGYFIDRHPRSPLGGVMIVAVGGILLSANLRGEHSVIRIFGLYWFWLLVALITGRILHQYTHRLADGPRPVAFSPAAILLMMFIAGSGLAANYLAKKTQKLPAMDLGLAHIGDLRNYVIGNQVEFEDEPPQTFALAPDSRLIIDGAKGDVEISAADQPQASVRIIKKIRALSEDEARSSAQNIRLQFSQDGNNYRIGVSASSGFKQDFSTSIVLTLPRNIESGVEVIDCAGSAKLTGLHGDHIIRNGEKIEVSDHTGRIRIESPRGLVELKRVRGGINLIDARSGSVTVEDLEGPATIDARGDVMVRNFHDLLDIRTENGTIRLSTTGMIGADIKAINENGRIQLSVPDDAAFRLDATSARGRVRVSGFNRINLQHGERSKVSQVFGYNVTSTAPNLILETSNGDIEVKSSGPVIASRKNDGDN
jgi:DUF4097 and DUF4098 domain-containing protein YvlB/uncharacterized membrane protein HdeD (DUF308 family)